MISTQPVAVDVMGADFGLGPVVDGALLAARELGIASIVVGNEAQIVTYLKSIDAQSEPLIKIQHASEVVTMDDSPSSAIRRKHDSSVRVAFELVKRKEACAVVSPGNTGAVMAAGVYVSGTLSGIARPAIATLIPKVGDAPPTVLIDSGANVDCHAEQLIQFALMGNYYARSVIRSERPRLALLSNGTESSKGNDVVRAAAAFLATQEDLNFIGYIEGRDICKNVVDVVVCDGFVGNIVLKAMEGTVELVLDSIREQVKKSLRGQFGMWLAKPMLKQLFQQKLDPSAYGGAPLLGLSDVAIICHGSSKGRAIMNGIRVAHQFAKENLIPQVQKALAGVDLTSSSAYEDGMWNRVGQRFDKQSSKSQNSRGAAAGNVAVVNAEEENKSE